MLYFMMAKIQTSLSLSCSVFTFTDAHCFHDVIMHPVLRIINIDQLTQWNH